MIEIHWDYSTGKEISYIEGLDKGDNFQTHCIDFFSTESKVEVVVRKKNGWYP